MFHPLLEIAVRALTHPLSSPGPMVCLALLVPLAAWTQSPDGQRDAAHPDAPVAPLVHPALQTPPAAEAPSANAWREAHEALSPSATEHATSPATGQQAGDHTEHSLPGTAPDASAATAPPANGGHTMRPQPPQSQPHRHAPMHPHLHRSQP